MTNTVRQIPLTRTATSRSSRRGLRRRRSLIGLAIAAPALVVFAYFAWIPIVQGAILGFQKTDLVSPAEWVGWKNFEFVLTDPVLPTAVLNTLAYAAIGLLIGFPLPLLGAVFIAELRRTRQLATVLAYLPVVIPPAVSVLLWKTFYDPSASGVFNTVLGWFGIGPVAWLNSPATALPSIVVESSWAGAGTMVVIYLAALTSVRPELYEAAELDGSGIVSRVWHITLPAIRNVAFLMVLLQLIAAFQIFTEPFIFTGGGPNNATITILMLIYNYAFVGGNFGAGAALSLLLAAALAVFSILYNVLTRRWSDD